MTKKTNVLDKKKTASQMKTSSHEVSDGSSGLSEEEVKERVDEAVSAATKAYVSSPGPDG